MSANAVEQARHFFDRLSRVTDPAGRRLDLLDGETISALGDYMHPEVEMHEDPRFPEADTYRGVKEIRNYLTQFTESFDEFSFEPEDFLEVSDDSVLVLLHIRTRGKESGATADVHAGWIYGFRDGKVWRIDAFFDRNDAFAAAGIDASG
jgi:ketosteroid isomerase-like protein